MISKAPAPSRKPSAPRGRKRSVAAEAAILDAAIKLLRKKPLREVTAEAIAKSAGVSKATIYKWWPNKTLVALDAFLTRMRSDVTTPDTGSVRRDFTEQLKSLIRFLGTPYGRIYAQFIAEGQSDPKFLDVFRERFLRQRRDEVRVMWCRGVKRGELCGKVDPEIALDLIYGAVIFRLLTRHAPLNDEQAEQLIAAAFRGLQGSGKP